MTGKRDNRSGGFLIGALVGSIVGAVGALLLAPKSGKELRKDIAEGAQQVSEKTVQTAHVIGEQTSKIAGQVGEQTSQLVDKAKTAAGSVAGEVRAWRERRTSKAEISSAVSETVDAVDAVDSVDAADAVEPSELPVVTVQQEKE
ncbi:YtxH domain-containing protein [Paenibacillus daejeonensis]|uniref:YtxH domain-containing protein n=1 Tax=Paenibacillus daejeonensis TaxID=135193 RepID=UPI0003812906|nr:YtxH domain-containing protein [Paenibacillus daejeonensis]